VDRLQSMRVFQAVVDEGGFAAAARKLDLAPAVVTRLVGDLEQHLGVRLLHRTTRRLSVTQAGEIYLARLRVILSEIDEAQSAVQEHSREMSGSIRMLAPPAAARHVIAPVATAFQRVHPGVTIDVVVGDNAHPAVEDYDLTVVTEGAHIDADVIVRTIIVSQTIFCAAPEYLARHGTPATPEDLKQHRVLRLRPPRTRLRPMKLFDCTAMERSVEVDVRPVMTATELDTLLRATIDGGGISSQPVELVASMLRSGQLRRVLAPWISERLRLVAVLPSREFMPLRTRAFLDFLVAYSRDAVAGLGIDAGDE
jgi:DNA-binding transcriptional LysR family regulator